MTISSLSKVLEGCSGLLMLLFLSASPVVSENAPSFGMMIGTNGGGILDYECTELSEGRIECDFVQVLLSSKASTETLAEELKNAQDVLNEIKTDESICERVSAWKMVTSDIEGLDEETRRLGEETIDALQKDTEHLDQRSRMIQKQNLSFFAEVCKEMTLESVESLIRRTHEQKASTCTPFINRYSQTYVRVDQNTWVVESSPTGACGVVNVSRFLRSDSSLPLWDHTAQKVVTNKNGRGLLNCSDLDESEQYYKWNSPPVVENCTFIGQ